jgi:hypothetical protein
MLGTILSSIILTKKISETLLIDSEADAKSHKKTPINNKIIHSYDA